MKVTGVFKLMGVQAQPGFKDPQQISYIIGLAQGMESLRMYLEPTEYELYKDIPSYSDVDAVLDFNPLAKDVRYCMHLVTLAPVNKSSAVASGK